MPAPRNLWAWRAGISSLLACSRPAAGNNIPSANSPNFSWPLARSRDCVIAAATRSASNPAERSPSLSDREDDSSYGGSDCSRPQPSPETSFVTATRSMTHILPHPPWCTVAGDHLSVPYVSVPYVLGEPGSLVGEAVDRELWWRDRRSSAQVRHRGNPPPPASVHTSQDVQPIGPVRQAKANDLLPRLLDGASLPRPGSLPRGPPGGESSRWFSPHL